MRYHVLFQLALELGIIATYMTCGVGRSASYHLLLRVELLLAHAASQMFGLHMSVECTFGVTRVRTMGTKPTPGAHSRILKFMLLFNVVLKITFL